MIDPFCFFTLLILDIMTAQSIHSRLSHPHLQRYTLVFRNGELLRHQDPLSVAQYKQDARLVQIQPESFPD